MRAILVTLPKSGTRMMTSLIDSHPDLTCRFQDESADVMAVHFHNLRWEWLSLPTILLVRDFFDGAVSEMVSPHGERANHVYELSPASVATAMRRRELYTELLRPHADLELDFDAITQGQDVETWRDSDALCRLLGVKSMPLRSTMRRLPKLVPANMEAIRGRAFG